MNKFTIGMIAGAAAGLAGLAIASDKSIRRKMVEKGEDIMEKAEGITEKYIRH